ncbi:hypothetical protein PAMA_002034 [Pampus argenteus]
MKSVFFSRFFILLPWVLIVIIMIDIDSKRTIRVPAAGRNSRAQRTARTGAPGIGGTQNQSALPVIYAITPTYTRPVQKAELTRLAHAFRQVPRLHWIVVEDSTARTELVARFLARCGVPYTHLHVFTPRRFKRAGMPRATEQRNVALAWLRQHRTKRDAGVVFFADDDNTYSLELFEEGPCKERAAGVQGKRRRKRKRNERQARGEWKEKMLIVLLEMRSTRGFAVNLQVILANPRAQFKRRGSQPGMQESDFLKQITKVTELEPKANNCTRVLVWHTRTEKPHLANEPKHRKDTVVIEV